MVKNGSFKVLSYQSIPPSATLQDPGFAYIYVRKWMIDIPFLAVSLMHDASKALARRSQKWVRQEQDRGETLLVGETAQQDNESVKKSRQPWKKLQFALEVLIHNVICVSSML